MSVRTKKCWRQQANVFFTPKLSIDVQPRQDPFFHVWKKPLTTLHPQRPVCVVGRSKEVQSRTIHSGGKRYYTNDIHKVDSPLLENFKKQLPLLNLHKKQFPIAFTKEFLLQTSKKQFIVLESLKKQSSILKKYFQCSEPNKNLYLDKKIVYSNKEGSSNVQQQILAFLPKQLYLAKEAIFFYSIGQGNNDRLVRSIIERRINWTSTLTSLYHLRWDPCRQKYRSSANQKQLLNHLPWHQCLTDKGSLLVCLRNYCEKEGLNLFSVIPVSFVFDFSSQNVQTQLKRFVNCYYEMMHLQHSEHLVQKNIRSQRHNKVDNNVEKKKEEIKILYKQLINKMKPTYNFQNMSTIKKEVSNLNPTPRDIYGDSQLWLLKPSDLNRGRGIHLFRQVSEVGQLLKGQLQKHEQGAFVVQKYIEKPMLLNGRKFDIRIWVLMTHTKEILVCKTGYVRLAGESFSLDSLSKFTHLTNNAVQVHAANYGSFEEGNILPLSAIYPYIAKENLFCQMHQRIQLAFAAAADSLFVSPSLSPCHQQSKYFQIFGFDFMVDQNSHIWLIEINTNPCLELPNKLLSHLIPRMIDDAFKLTIDKVFPKGKLLIKGIAPLRVQGFENQESIWQSVKH